jgi:hypothetical protein
MVASSQRGWPACLAPMLILVMASACVATLMWWKAPAASAQEVTSSDPSFVVRCDFSHQNSDDPIVAPGQRGGSHLHDFFGNRSTNYASTYRSLRAAATTCFNPADTAAYWIPTVYWNDITLRPSHALFYYRTAGRARITAGAMAGTASRQARSAPMRKTYACRK